MLCSKIVSKLEVFSRADRYSLPEIAEELKTK